MAVVLWAGSGAAVLFVAVFLVDGWTRPGYSPMRHPVSALALGPRGWLQAADFLCCGLLITAAAAGVLGATAHPLLAAAIAVFGLALTASGAFRMDPMRGYPPGAPEGTPDAFSPSHRVHDAAGAVVFLSLPAAAGIAAFALDGVLWSAYSGLTAVALLVLFGLFGRAWEGDWPNTGLIQRLTIIVGWTWLALLLADLAAATG
ncbi:hypothetical protein LP52_14600 [Streptomonospora alba]|uniref:DUF998 domain-containing protein n=1 Tax=Streptomonospora alba TaxID=183763 RepID=A0A0C2FFY8_9ACTN|nr:DUF998 domain-containing protein [Streptomonospora alba]KIH98159.1 hypothetical protein LP52_14600 [Streptomonospora alba]